MVGRWRDSLAIFGDRQMRWSLARIEQRLWAGSDFSPTDSVPSAPLGWIAWKEPKKPLPIDEFVTELIEGKIRGRNRVITLRDRDAFGAHCPYEIARRSTISALSHACSEQQKAEAIAKTIRSPLTNAAGDVRKLDKLAAGGAAALGGAGYLMSKVMGGFGLASSAVALDGAAAALTAAAGALGGPAAVAKGVAAPAAATGGVGSAIWAGGAAALPWLGGAAAVGGSMLALSASVDSAGYAGMTGGERLTKGRKGSMRDVYRRDWNEDRRRLGIPLMEGNGNSTPYVGQTWTYGTGVGGNNGGQLTATVTGKVDGEAQVTVKVEAGSSLLQVVENAKAAMKLAGSINSNGAGSTGKSSPDAAAPSRPVSTGASGRW